MAAAATFRSLLHGIPSFPCRSPAVATILPETKLIPVKPPLRAILRLPLLSQHRLLRGAAAASAAAAYTDTDGYEPDAGDEVEEGEDEEQQQQQQPLATKSVRPRDAARLYVGNLPFSMTPTQLAEVFGQAGTVETVEVIYDRVTDRSRGFAFVTMGSVEEANEAIRMFDGSQVGGRIVKVNFPEVPRGGEREVMGPRMRTRGYIDSPHKIYAGNLGWTVTSEDLRNAFAAQPGILGAKVIFERDTGRSRGFGFVSFASAKEAQAAMETMNGVEVEGRPLRLSPAARTPAASPSQDSGVEVDSQEASSASLEVSGKEESSVQSSVSY
ncbi:RNA-binding protein CP33, chloroplastic [Phoenix dactylifera]|uniref:RNA-binding protein CP33, chloroplastic n=1 Tax=Phoenix dactylifera TaxID=42345 RepID=A0A8B7D1U6_PHODC|nr:RNA-binding protein CP33, chloroplastic [Phoenix dactylifera]